MGIISFVVQLFNLFSRPEKYEKDIRDIVEYFERKKEKKISAGSGDEVDTRFPPFPHLHFIVNLRKHHRGGNCLWNIIYIYYNIFLWDKIVKADFPLVCLYLTIKSDQTPIIFSLLNYWDFCIKWWRHILLLWYHSMRNLFFFNNQRLITVIRVSYI